MKNVITLLFPLLLLGRHAAPAADVYGSAATAQSIALGGIYLDSPGPTDALAANPALLTSLGQPYLEVTGMGVLAGGTFRNSTPTVGHLESNAGVAGSAAFGLAVPHTRLSLGAGIFPVSLLSDRWLYRDPAGVAGATYGLQTNKSAFLALQSSFGLAYRISDHVQAGAALGIVDNLNTLDTPYVFQTNPTVTGLKTLLLLHTSGIGYNGTFGVTAQPLRRLALGAAYKTRTVVRTTGQATGDAYAQFAALGLPYPSSFRYRAEVDNTFPQSASLSLGFQMRPRVRTFLQGDWLNWRDAFTELPVHLTGGNNLLLNTLLEGTSLNDNVPLHWKNQFTARAGIDISLGEAVTLQSAYAHANSPVPSATLTPLTAAIMSDSLSSGLGYVRSRYRLQLAYQVNLPQTATVTNSALLAGEYSNTRTSLWLQTLALTTGIRF